MLIKPEPLQETCKPLLIFGLVTQSLFVQQHLPDSKDLGDTAFAQACILARQCGWNQASSSPGRLTDVTEELRKVFRSLYIRDRCYAIACGAPIWLPHEAHTRFDSPPPQLRLTDGEQNLIQPYNLHYIQHGLAQIQSELLNIFAPNDTQSTWVNDRKGALVRVRQRLEDWARDHGLQLPSSLGDFENVWTQLAFLGTRVQILNACNEMGDNFNEELLSDCQLTCLIFAASCLRNPSPTILQRLKAFPMRTASPIAPIRLTRHESSIAASSSSSSSPASRTPSGQNISRSTNSMSSPTSTPNLAPLRSDNSPPLPCHRLSLVFPITSIFVLVRRIIGLDRSSPQLPPAESIKDLKYQQELSQDIELLEAMSECFDSANTPTPAYITGTETRSNRSKLSLTIKHLLDIIRAIKASRLGDQDQPKDNTNLVPPQTFFLPPSPALPEPSPSTMNLLSLQESTPSCTSGQMYSSIPPSTLSSATGWATYPPQTSVPTVDPETSIYTSPYPGVNTTSAPGAIGAEDLNFETTEFWNQFGEPGVNWGMDGMAHGEWSVPMADEQQLQQCAKETRAKMPSVGKPSRRKRQRVDDERS